MLPSGLARGWRNPERIPVPPLRYGITQRSLFPDLSPESYLDLAIRTSAHVIQWREKDLPSEVSRRILWELRSRARRRGCLLLLNGDVEGALELGLDGVHLTSRQSAAEVVRRLPVPSPLLIGQSVHSLEEALAAAAAGVDYLLVSPVFAPLSKSVTGPALGLAGLAELALEHLPPIIALGGVTQEHWPELERIPGVVGFAGITWLADEIRLATGDGSGEDPGASGSLP